MQVELLFSEKAYQGKVFDIRRDQVKFPGGHVASLDIVIHNNSVSLVPVDAHGQIWFVRQYRHPTGDQVLELPAGVMEEGESPVQTAGREIQEEIGMAAEKLLKIGEFWLAPGYCTEYMYVYLATGLFPSSLPADDDEHISVEKIPIAQAIHMAQTGELHDVKSIAALMLARPYLE